MKKILFLALILVIIFFAVKFFIKKPAGLGNNNSQGSQQQLLPDAVNGVKVSQEIAGKRPLAVMVENHPDAWPQSGLSQADIVYEALAEGGITRFLAIYQSQEVKFIGPVRSAREYYAQIANEWGAVYAHVGGSNEVIAQIKNGVYKNLDDANEYYNFDFFPRKKNKPQPHHIFTSTEKLNQLIDYHKYSSQASYQPFLFKDDEPAATSTATQIDIDFSRAGYEVRWVYDTAINSYKRLQYFERHLDAENNQQLIAKTVVAQLVKVTPVPKDPLLSVDIDLVSGGQARVFLDGSVIEGTWKKSTDGKTRYYDRLGQEIKFNRGPIWVELVPVEKGVDFK